MLEGRLVSSFDFISGSEIDFQNDRIPLLDMSSTGRNRSKITSPNDLLSNTVSISTITGISGSLQNQIDTKISESSANSQFVKNTGSESISGVKNFISRPTVNGTGVLLSGEVQSTGYLTGYISKSESGDFYSNSNPSGFITGLDLSNYSTVPYVTGISGVLQVQITVLNNQTGDYYLKSNPYGFITGNVVRPSDTGNFLTTEIADLKYIGLSGDQFVTGNKTFVNDVKLSTLSGNGVVKTSGSNGSLYIDTGVYLTYVQQSSVSIPTSGSVIDDEARVAISGILIRLQSLGLFA